MTMLALSSGCGLTAASVTQLTDETLPPKPDDCPMKVWMTTWPAADSYDEIAAIEVSGQASSLDDRIQRLKAEACKVGADGLIITLKSAGELTNKMQAVAIVERSPP
ncbi:MAG: hypothetical protein AAFX99_19855 [Myxococcota bacterium]